MIRFVWREANKLKMYLTFCIAKSKINWNYRSISVLKCLNQRQIMTSPIEVPVQTDKLLRLAKSTIVPKLTDDKHKGQYGRVGVVGGSLEYTGAPYFAAISALKVGADLAHIFCQRNAAVVIKSYSPELIVHPVLDTENALELIKPWLTRLHVLVIGPGLGRESHIMETVVSLIKLCQKVGKPLVIDADGLFLLSKNPDLINGGRNIILTPNAFEFRNLFCGDNCKTTSERMSELGEGVIVLEKGATDKIHIPSTAEVYTLPPGGSGRRCGGQGDLLSGSLATFFHWALESNQSNPGFLAAFCASYLVKECNAAAYHKSGRSMLASDMIEEISPIFNKTFECDPN